MIMYKSTIRLDVVDDTVTTRLEEYLAKYDYPYLVYHEYATNTKKPHYQGVIHWPSESLFKSARVRLYTMFKDLTKGRKSMACVRKDAYEIYITKDKDLRYRNGFTDEQIEELSSQSYEKDKTVSGSTGFKKAFDYVVGRGYSDSTNGWEIAEALIDYYRESVKCEPNDFQIRNMAKSIYTHMVFDRSQKQGKHIYESYRRERAKQIIGNEWIFSPL